MSDDFPLVREAFAESVPGRVLAMIVRVVQSAWHTSAVGDAARSRAARAAAMPPAQLVATIAAAVAIASALQPLLISLMPPTVAPALPWPAFIVIAAFAALIAWQSAAFVTAWRNSPAFAKATAWLASRPTPPSREHTRPL